MYLKQRVSGAPHLLGSFRGDRRRSMGGYIGERELKKLFPGISVHLARRLVYIKKASCHVYYRKTVPCGAKNWTKVVYVIPRGQPIRGRQGQYFHIDDDPPDRVVGLIPGTAFPAGPGNRSFGVFKGIILAAGDLSPQPTRVGITKFLREVGKNRVVVFPNNLTLRHIELVEILLAYVDVVEIPIVNSNGSGGIRSTAA